jgi:hypothetical protein
MAKIEVFDSGANSGFDRYTVVLDGEYVFGMSSNPLWVGGFNQFVGQLSEGRLKRKNFGRKVPYADVPADVKEAIRRRINSQ